ncbi:MAG: phosphoserine transaminase [Egibacteraceae bacterium]
MPITVPISLLPADGRFGSGPSKVRQEAVRRLGVAAPSLLGTSHRQPTVKAHVRRIRNGLREFFSLPDGFEVVLGNGGATLCWDAAVHCLISRRSAHAVFGEFSAKFADAVRAAPFLDDPVISASQPGSHPTLEAQSGVDLYALTQCETSTGVAMPVRRPCAAGLVAVDATSAAGGIEFDPAEVDFYYFSPQKCFGSEGGLFVALLSPAALERVDRIQVSGRYIPAMLDLGLAARASAQDETYNTPSISTLFLMGEQLDWLNEQGGLAAAAKDCAGKAAILYDWAHAREWAAPFVADPAMRSPVVCTLDLDPAIPAHDVASVLRANGIVDIEGYRRLGRNQLRIATFPAVVPADVERLTAAIDYVVEALAAS